MTDRQVIIQNFSACSLCGHFLATMLALAGETSLDQAIQTQEGPWLEWEWQPAFAQALEQYFNLHVDPGIEWHSGQCPVCRRRITYQRQPEGASLQVEGQPGLRR